MQLLISVIVPVYNLAKYIERTLNCILAQTHQELEVIVVDDGSCDSSWDVITRMAIQDDRILPVHQENAGVTAARLKGVSLAKGEWIGFVDGDDTIDKDMYAFLLNNALTYHTQISHCGYRMVFSDGRVNEFHGTGQLRLQNRVSGVCDLLEGTLVEPGLCNKLYHRELFQDLSAWMPRDIRINEDLLMNYYLFSKADTAVFVDRCCYHYLVRQGSASRQKINDNKLYDPIRVKEIIVNQAEEEILPIARRAYMSTCINAYNALVLERVGDYSKELTAVRKRLLRDGSWRRYLSSKQRLLFALIRFVPATYPVLYRIYAKYILKSPYQ